MKNFSEKIVLDLRETICDATIGEMEDGGRVIGYFYDGLKTIISTASVMLTVILVFGRQQSQNHFLIGCISVVLLLSVIFGFLTYIGAVLLEIKFPLSERLSKERKSSRDKHISTMTALMIASVLLFLASLVLIIIFVLDA